MSYWTSNMVNDYDQCHDPLCLCFALLVEHNIDITAERYYWQFILQVQNTNILLYLIIKSSTVNM